MTLTEYTEAVERIRQTYRDAKAAIDEAAAIEQNKAWIVYCDSLDELNRETKHERWVT